MMLFIALSFVVLFLNVLILHAEVRNLRHRLGALETTFRALGAVKRGQVR